MINASCLSQLEQSCVAEGQWYSLRVENVQKSTHPSRHLPFWKNQQNRHLRESAFFLNKRNVWNMR